MSVFGTIKTAVGKGASRIEEQIEKEKRKAAEQSDIKALERKRYYELVGGKDAWKDPAAAKARGGLSPSEALMQIERERQTQRTEKPRAERYQKVYPGVKQTKTQAKQTSKKAMVFGALKTIASNVQANVASGRAGVGGTFKQPDMGMGFGNFGFGNKPGTDMFGFPIAKSKKARHEPQPSVVGHDMWGQPIYGQAPKGKHKGHNKGRGRGKTIVIKL